MKRKHVLECQVCGAVLRVLTEAEAQRVAERPYEAVFTCGSPACRQAVVQPHLR